MLKEKFKLLKNELRTLSAYRGRFGVLRGFFTFLKLYRGGSGEVRVAIPPYPIPIVVRRKTSDVAAFEQVFVKLAYDLRVDHEPKFIIDGGANVGYTTIYFAHRWPGARIVSVEPEASNYEILSKNVAPYPNVTPVHAGLWSTRTYLEIQNPSDDKWAFRVKPSKFGKQGSLAAITIEELIDDAGAKQIDILKLDVEGAEKEIFSAGYGNWLGKVKAMVLEIHDWIMPGASNAVFSATSQYSFKHFQQGENVVFVKNP